MATSAPKPGRDPEQSKRERLVSQFFFIIMVFGIWLGLALPPVAGGVINLALLLAGAYSAYRVFTGVRVAI